jgi:hypothetical protein
MAPVSRPLGAGGAQHTLKRFPQSLLRAPCLLIFSYNIPLQPCITPSSCATKHTRPRTALTSGPSLLGSAWSQSSACTATLRSSALLRLSRCTTPSGHGRATGISCTGDGLRTLPPLRQRRTAPTLPRRRAADTLRRGTVDVLHPPRRSWPPSTVSPTATSGSRATPPLRVGARHTSPPLRQSTTDGPPHAQPTVASAPPTAGSRAPRRARRATPPSRAESGRHRPRRPTCPRARRRRPPPPPRPRTRRGRGCTPRSPQMG